jgi:urease accessory protein
MDAWILHQLADSAFPTGGFAHSGGLEAAVQLRRVDGVAGLAAFVEESLWQAGTFSLPFVVAGLERPEDLVDLDARYDAALPGHVANAASRTQGRAFLRVAAQLSPGVAQLASVAADAAFHHHLAPVFGATLRCLDGTAGEACPLFLFCVARGILSAGVRLGLVGPLEAQRLLAATSRTAADVVKSVNGRTVADAAATFPLLDLLQSHQHRLYSRLFRS